MRTLRRIPGARKIGVYLSVLCLSALFPVTVTSALANASPPTTDAAWYDGQWAHERSDLPPHPKATFGRLANGLRYVILPNAKPKGRVHLSLDVQVGSLMENDDELGLAHYLEHMAFNGSRHYPPGALIPLLQRHGMSFGGDVNAHTARTETVYKLDLASAAPQDIAQGFSVLRDIADGLLLLPEEVERERGVILSEKAARDSEGARVSQAWLKTVFPGTRFINETIGEDAVIRAANSEILRRFYDAWYRPERMVLVIVGTVDPKLIDKEVARLFADVRGRGPARTVPYWGDALHQGLITQIEKTSATGLSLTISAIHPRREEHDSLEVQRRQLLDSLAREMLQNRLIARVSKGSAPFLGGRFSISRSFDLFPMASLSMSCQAERWKDCLSAADQEVRRALETGFSVQDFEQARTSHRTQFEALPRRAHNRTNKDLAAEIVETINADRVIQSDLQTRDLYLGLLNDVQKEDVERTFRSLWNSGNRLILASGNVDAIENTEALAAAWHESQNKPVEASATVGEQPFPYLPIPEQAAEITEDHTRPIAGEDLTLRTMRLANGMTLQMLPTPFEKGRFVLSLSFGKGLSTLSDQDRTVAQATERTLRQNGPGRLTIAEARQILAGKSLKIEEGYREESFVISGSATKEDQALLLQTLWTQYRDPTVTEDGRRRMLDGLHLSRNQRNNTVEGVTPREVEQFLFAGVRRDNAFDDETASGVTLEQMQSFLARSRSTGPTTLVAVGDFDPESLLRESARLFASTPSSEEIRPSLPPVAFPVGETRRVSVDEADDKAVVMLAWRRDLADESDQRTLAIRRLLASALNDHLRERVREELGATYSPSGNYRHDQTLEGFGMFVASIQTAPRTVDVVRSAAKDVARTLAQDGVVPGTVERLRAPILANLEVARRNNSLWLRLIELESLRARPYTRWNAELAEHYRAITDDDLSQEARAVFAREAAELSIIAAGKKQKATP